MAVGNHHVAVLSDVHIGNDANTCWYQSTVHEPYLIAALVFVFIPTIGEFVTPLLVGGPSGYMFGNAINDLFTRSLDWQTGSVLAIFLLAVVAVLMAFFGRSISVRSVAQ